MSNVARLPVPVAPSDVLESAEIIIREQEIQLREKSMVIAQLRARLGEEGPHPDGVVSLRRLRLLEDASDAARTHLLGGPVTRKQALDLCEAARRQP